MAKQAQIKCINKQDRDNAWERITHVGGVNSDGGRWKLTQQSAIEYLEGDWDFWVSVDGDTVWCEVAVSRFGNKYIKTKADGDLPNNLLSLPECP
ncbi:DUF3892 domain-containing protein [Sulfitobacter sp. S190]|uniref:DUF3892 domain-containing protein n=1 Tax=Sulfitobacter sp. S190 TaxID=2867022 RepID=UPI0021A391D1|nr:DUF3892 domain-containing protein [Sulfitobacter sp. S190]UWR23452.1 DUF3892 domain-containing protein [Sulfitobacter sp. S190]